MTSALLAAWLASYPLLETWARPCPLCRDHRLFTREGASAHAHKHLEVKA